MKQKSNIDYHIKCITPSEYELEFKLHADNKTLLMLFNKAKNKLMRDRGVNVGNPDIEKINEFDVPEVYFKFLKVTIKKIYNNARNKFLKSKIDLMSYDIETAKFTRNEKRNWDISIKLKGIYADKR